MMIEWHRNRTVKAHSNPKVDTAGGDPVWNTSSCHNKA